MADMNSPESLSPNRLNQASISETLSEYPHFEFTAVNAPEPETVGAITNIEANTVANETKKSAKNNDSSNSENNSSIISLKQGTPPILRRGNRRRARADSGGLDGNEWLSASNEEVVPTDSDLLSECAILNKPFQEMHSFQVLAPFLKTTL